MKIMIDVDGHLNLQRGADLKVQECPFHEHPGREVVYCGDWCPMCSEGYRGDEGQMCVTLHCKNVTWHVDPGNFLDLRGAE